MRTIIFYFQIFFSLSIAAQNNNPFLHLKFDKVIMYDFVGGKGGDLYIVDDNGKLATTISKEVKLDKANIVKLNTKLGDKKSFGGGTAACFDPHLGFAYFLKDKIIAHITICLDCNRLRSSIDIPGQKQGRIGKGKDVYYIADGLSNSFRKFINKLLLTNNFSHQIIQ